MVNTDIYTLKNFLILFAITREYRIISLKGGNIDTTPNIGSIAPILGIENPDDMEDWEIDDHLRTIGNVLDNFNEDYTLKAMRLYSLYNEGQ